MNENSEQENIEEVVIAEKETILDLHELDLNQLISRLEKLSNNSNPYSVSKEIALFKSEGKDCNDKIISMKEVSDKIKEADKEIDALEKKINENLLYIPNIIHESVPIGKSEDENVLVREYGEKPNFDFEIKDHLEISSYLNLLVLKL